MKKTYDKSVKKVTNEDKFSRDSYKINLLVNSGSKCPSGKSIN